MDAARPGTRTLQEGRKETDMKERIGFVGLGQMGQPLALNLLRSGYRLRVFDVREERMAPLVAQGAEPGASPGDVSRPGGIVLSMVPDDRALLAVALGEGGILRRIGECGIHLSLSTVSPEVAAQLAKLYEEQGSYYLTATVLGRPEVAQAARLSLFLSGHPAAKERVLPLLQVLGTHLYDLGERVEVANVVKLGYNFLIAAAIEAMGEAAALVEQCGADRAQFLRMLVESPLFTGAVYEGYGLMIGERDYSAARFPVSLGLKDVELVLRLAEHARVPLPYAEIVHEHLQAAQRSGRSQEDWSALADFVTGTETGAAVAARAGGAGRTGR
jgi:3-hydroxyisobutyrate dehydrogenase-like beta-hydroxyacid dehydrogenase